VSAPIEGRYAIEWPSDDGSPGCRVVAIGDSTMSAEGLDHPSQLWIHGALESIHRHTGQYLRLVVLPKRGARLAQVERLAERVDEEEPDVVVVAVGTNDVVPPLQRSYLLDYPNRYRQLVRRLHAPDRAVVVTGVGNLWYSPALTRSPLRQAMRAPAAVLSWYIDRSIRRAVTGMPRVERIATRPVDRVMWDGRDWLYSADGFHPTAAGHAVWANLARPALVRAIASVAPADRARERPADSAPAPRVRPVRDADEYRFVRTRSGVARVRDTRGRGRVVILMPDSPNVLEHHESTFRELRRDFRVVGLEMPGAGYTDLRLEPSAREKFDFSLGAGARWILDVMRNLEIDRAILTASCVNGLYAASAAVREPERVDALVLCQTPSVAELQAWARRTIHPVLRSRFLGDPVLRVARRQLAGMWYRKALGAEAPAGMQQQFEDIARQGFRGGAAWRLAPLMRAIRAEPADVVNELDTPTLVLWGDHDLTHRDAGTDPESLPGRRKETVRVPTGHFPELEAPETFADAVRKMAEHVVP
jgi:pimeloyl-ACP methyl ester carboxylesterase/lysophospholipase L1-like esterase